jgi:uncharacterized protein (DUF1697 family)
MANKKQCNRSETCLALLRGVNLVGRRQVAMADLRMLFETLGYTGVRTLLNSGNVIFSASPETRNVAAQIEKALASKLELTCPVIVLSAEEVNRVVRGNPFSGVATNPSYLLVVAPQDPARLTKLKPLLKQKWGREELGLSKRVAYLWCANGVAKSPLWTAVDRALERTGTARNISTFTKALAFMEEDPPLAR